VAVEHARVRVVEDGGFHPATHERLRLAHEELVEGIFAGDEDGEPFRAPASTSPLLAQAGDRAREPDRDRTVEQPDVDPELERVGRGHAEKLPLDEPAFDVAPLRGRVAGAIGRKALRELEPDPFRGEAVDQLG
jgi:hypothetical protein